MLTVCHTFPNLIYFFYFYRACCNILGYIYKIWGKRWWRCWLWRQWHWRAGGCYFAVSSMKNSPKRRLRGKPLTKILSHSPQPQVKQVAPTCIDVYDYLWSEVAKLTKYSADFTHWRQQRIWTELWPQFSHTKWLKYVTINRGNP